MTKKTIPTLEAAPADASRSHSAHVQGRPAPAARRNLIRSPDVPGRRMGSAQQPDESAMLRPVIHEPLIEPLGQATSCTLHSLGQRRRSAASDWR